MSRTLELHERLTPDAEDFSGKLAGYLNNLAGCVYDAGRYDEAERHWSRSAALREKLTADDPGDPERRFEAVASLGNLGLGATTWADSPMPRRTTAGPRNCARS